MRDPMNDNVLGNETELEKTRQRVNDLLIIARTQGFPFMLVKVEDLNELLRYRDDHHPRCVKRVPPDYQCRSCGSLGPFRTIKHNTPGEPIEYDMECVECDSTEIADSPREAFSALRLCLDGAEAESAELVARVAEMEKKHREELLARQTRYGRNLNDLMDLLGDAWAVIANAGQGNWSNELGTWRKAAERFRDRCHEALKKFPDRDPANTRKLPG